MAALQLVGVRKEFGDVQVIRGVDLVVEDGDPAVHRVDTELAQKRLAGDQAV